MIRINLLKPVAAAGSGTFPGEEARLISRREMWIGVTLLAAGGGLLYFLGFRPRAPRPPKKTEPAPSRAPEPAPTAASQQAQAVPAPSTPALESTEPTPAPAAEAKAVAPGAGFQVSAVSIERQAEALAVIVRVEPGATCTVNKLQNPNRLVIDIPNSRLIIPGWKYSQPVNHPVVKRVRASQFQLDPDISRIVLDVTSFPRYQVQPSPRGLEIRIPGGSQ